jgi:ABC-type dipeptide/oligopeptide/nickel transport system, ATPase component
MSCNVLEIEHLRLVLSNGGRAIVDDLSFSVHGGATVALVGESGCGKTMTTMAVMGLLPPGIRRIGGTIVVDGQDVSQLSPEAYRRLRNERAAVVMQNPMSAFDPVLTIDRHFRETLASHGTEDRGEIHARAAEALAEVGFDDPAAILALYPFQMSGGMLQRVMLAIALIASPPLVIADEATSDLDVLSQARILRLLKTHCEKHHSALLLITHDLSVAAGLADEVVLMKAGRLVEKSATRHFFQNPQTPYAQTLIALHRGMYTPRYRQAISLVKAREGKADVMMEGSTA